MSSPDKPTYHPPYGDDGDLLAAGYGVASPAQPGTDAIDPADEAFYERTAQPGTDAVLCGQCAQRHDPSEPCGGIAQPGTDAAEWAAELRSLRAEVDAADEPAYRHTMRGSYIAHSTLAGTVLPEWLRLRLLAALTPPPAEPTLDVRTTLDQYEALLALCKAYPESVLFRGDDLRAFAQQVLDIFDGLARLATIPEGAPDQ